jgi:hypothetical protein
VPLAEVCEDEPANNSSSLHAIELAVGGRSMVEIFDRDSQILNRDSQMAEFLFACELHLALRSRCLNRQRIVVDSAGPVET